MSSHRQFCEKLQKEIDLSCTDDNYPSCMRRHLMENEETKECAVDALVMAITMEGQDPVQLSSYSDGYRIMSNLNNVRKSR